MGAVALESFEDLVELEVEGGVMGCLAPLIRDVQVRAVSSEDIGATHEARVGSTLSVSMGPK